MDKLLRKQVERLIIECFNEMTDGINVITITDKEEIKKYITGIYEMKSY